MGQLFFVASGGALGALTRYGITLIALQMQLKTPYATLFANIIGCFLAGAFLSLTLKIPFSGRLFLLTGFLGGLTTFSTFSLESWSYFLEGFWGAGILHILLNLTLSLGATGLGFLFFKIW